MSSLYQRIKKRLSGMSDSDIKQALDRVDRDMREAYKDGSGKSVHVVGGATDLLPAVLADTGGMERSGLTAYFGAATGEYLQSRLSGGFFGPSTDSYSVDRKTSGGEQVRTLDDEHYLGHAA